MVISEREKHHEWQFYCSKAFLTNKTESLTKGGRHLQWTRIEDFPLLRSSELKDVSVCCLIQLPCLKAEMPPMG